MLGESVRESTSFPEFIAPFQPFTDVHGIQHEIESGVVVEVRFEGEVFETEELLSGANPRLVLPGFGLGVIEFLA